MFGRSTTAIPCEPAESSTAARARALDAKQSANKRLAAATAALDQAEDARRGHDEIARFEADAAWPTLLVAHRRAAADAAKADVAFKAADEAWRRDQAKVYFPKIAAAAQVLDRCLREAREANRALGEAGLAARADGGGAAFPVFDFQWPILESWAFWHERYVRAGFLKD